MRLPDPDFQVDSGILVKLGQIPLPLTEKIIMPEFKTNKRNRYIEDSISHKREISEESIRENLNRVRARMSSS